MYAIVTKFLKPSGAVYHKRLHTYENCDVSNYPNITPLFETEKQAKEYMKVNGMCQRSCCNSIRPVTLTDNSEKE